MHANLQCCKKTTSIDVTTQQPQIAFTRYLRLFFINWRLDWLIGTPAAISLLHENNTEKIARWTANFHHENEAATIVEYAIMLALIVLLAIVAIATVGQESRGLWGDSATELDNALN